MADNRQYTALEWVVREIRETLQESQRVLESYASDPQDLTQLRFCQTLIHQVYGSLCMVGFHGAAMLAEEMEALTQAMLSNEVRVQPESLEVLMRGIIQLPDYLEQVQQTRRDYPAIVLSLLNDIRSVRGASLLSESTLFTPNLAPAHQLEGRPHPLTQDVVQLPVVIAKLRQMYQYAAASVIHQVNVDENLTYLIKVADRLQKMLRGTRRYAVWEIAYAVIEGLYKKVIVPTAAIKSLLRELDGELKQLEIGGTGALNQYTSDELLKNLLYYIGATDNLTPAIDGVKKRYELNQLMPLAKVAEEQQDIRPVDMTTLRAVATAIREEFIQIKANLDACLQGGELSGKLDFIQNALQRVNDTLAILGVGELRQKVNRSVIAIASMRHQAGSIGRAQLEDVAGALADIEFGLDAALSATSGSDTPFHLDAAQTAVLEECRNGLEKSKDAIVDYIATQWDVAKLASVPEHMRAVRGSLTILSLSRAADILTSCIHYIETQLIEQGLKPKWQQLDSLADVIASVDYYLEYMSAARENDETILDKAQAGLESLGVVKAVVESIHRDPSSHIGAVENTAFENVSPPLPIIESAEPEEDEIDAEVTEIFVEEAGEIQEKLDEFLPLWAADYNDELALVETRRAFHTLKGSGRMVRASDIGELAWSIENMLNRVMDNTITPSPVHIALINKVRAILPDMVSAYKHRQANPHHTLSEQYMAWAHQLSRNEQSNEILQALMGASVTASSIEDEAVEEEEIDAQLWEIFGTEAEGHLAVVNDYIEQMDAVRPFYEPPSDPMQRALHTLKGSAYMAELTPIAELMAPLEKFAKELRSYQVNIDDDTLQLIKDGVSYTQEALAQIEQLHYPEIPKHDQYMARIHELRERSVGPLIRQKEAEKAQQKVDPAVLEVLMAEGMNLLLDADLMLEEWQTRPASSDDWQPLRNELSNLCHGAERANLQAMASLSRALEVAYEQLIDGQVAASNETYALLLIAHNELMNVIDAIAAGQDLPPENSDLLAQLASLPNTHPVQSASVSSQSPEGYQEGYSQYSVVDNTSAAVADLGNDAFHNDLPSADTPWSEPLTESVLPEISRSDEADLYADKQTTFNEDDVDEETVEIFLEEANELLEELDQAIDDWENGGDSHTGNESLQRALHTFKGGARLAGLSALGDLSHDFEAYLIDNAKNEQASNIFDRIHEYQDQLIRLVSGLEHTLHPETMPPVNPLVDDGEPEDQPELVQVDYDNVSEDEDSEIHSVDSTNNASAVDSSPITHSNSGRASNVLPFANKPSGLTVLKEMPQAVTNRGNAAAARRNQPQEVVKVSAELMEELVNLAGETSISRGRMEEQISELGYSLEEMGATVQRLQEQLRRLDIETEAQIIFRQEQMAETDDFDPLEMDRYSQLQQLSRSLIESASDLMDLKGTLSDKTRDAETVLLQQSRINTDLQEGLMRSRMVPFSRIVPRLRRIVRQIATEVNKDVNLELGNIEGELDRSMMERMVAPIEHMLRNAIDHGIEDTATRLHSGKPAVGRIVITLDRDGGDVLIHVADDGRGIDIHRVRNKAIERNLMNVDADLSDQEILQFILHAGFSTAETITQISGRGVGMDVVNSEIRQMGGSIAIDSRSGEGTAFTIRVPFTVSVNRALMIVMGDDRYAIPLNSIEGIVRISPFELEHYYAHPDEPFEYAGQDYQLRYLGTLLDHTATPRLQGHTLPLPVLLVRSADHTVAVQVDQLQGSREIVVKSLGPQFRSVQGVSGATIMGDGRVVVILDSNALIRRSIARNLAHQAAEAIAAEQAPVTRNTIVMVVDDSVTVRKVTSRLLEREGYDVITAKDGVDAMTILQDQTPDIMLLDIEMPRMDGFEVAKNVRSSADLRHLPIIMITSRTGEKHRQRGLESGANLYMGKPYQEEILLESIRDLIHAAERSNV
jgi:chemosensory pili system protein ChpA (sensor histidine kinase/response regulator)